MPVYHRKHEELTGNLSVKIYVYKIENKITFKIKKGITTTFNSMELLGNTTSKILKDKNGENVPYLELLEYC